METLSLVLILLVSAAGALWILFLTYLLFKPPGPGSVGSPMPIPKCKPLNRKE